MIYMHDIMAVVNKKSPCTTLRTNIKKLGNGCKNKMLVLKKFFFNLLCPGHRVRIIYFNMGVCKLRYF
jgi:hypothetical protein